MQTEDLNHITYITAKWMKAELEVLKMKERLDDKQDEVNALRRMQLNEEGITEHGIRADRIEGIDRHFTLDTAHVPKVLTKNRNKYFERLKQKIIRGLQ